MAKSVRDLYNRALELLGVAASGQSPSAEDWQAMRTMLPGLLEELRATEAANIVVTTNNETATDIPDECFDPLAAILANDVAPSFGIPMLSGVDRETKLIRRLRSVTYGNPQFYTQDAYYY